MLFREHLIISPGGVLKTTCSVVTLNFSNAACLPVLDFCEKKRVIEVVWFLFSAVFFYRYGTKIRFPHALVMTFLFKDGT